MPASPEPLLLVFDGNSLLHRAYHASTLEPLRDAQGRPAWALRGLVTYIARAAAQLRPDALIVGFDCPVSSARKVDFPLYKAQRAEKPAELAEQILAAPPMLRAAGVCTVVPPAYEADDVLASCAELARGAGWRSVLMTSDRDAFALIDESTSVLRVRNGGFDEAVFVDSAKLPQICGVAPWQYRDFAALRGDPSDNLRGVNGFGTMTAARLLSVFGSVQAAFDALDSGGDQLVRDAVGDRATEQLAVPEMREVVARNRRLMQMRADLPMPDLDSARLPLDLAVMRQALRERGVNLGPSLWAITGGAPPPPKEDLWAGFEPRPWVRRRGLRRRQDPIPGQLTLF